ncbi:PTS sugar transporter subunit IIC [Virgibacillus halophilus]|uniref:PTS sugar transporter subunit IIC n=1 Tax=Tigheibacillus halophilus TaxID=361280 RepID=UPI0036390F20
MNNPFMQKFIEIAGRIGSQRHLVAIRDGFVAIMPLIIVGSLAVLINNFPPFGKFDLVHILNGIFGEGNWQQVGGSIWNGTFAVIGLLIAFSIAYNLAKSYEVDGLSAGLISGAAYIMLVPWTKDGGLDVAWLGTQGLFIAIILAIVLTELFRVLVKSKFTIKMPEGVPDGVARSFVALIPAVLILILVGLFQACMGVFAGTSIFEIVFNGIQKPLQGLGNTLPAAMIVAFANHFLWFFGLHGTNIIGSVIEPIYLPLIEENAKLFADGMSAFNVPYVVTKPFFDAFVYMGGSGTTIALLIAVFFVIRREKNHPYREVAKLSAPAGLFNINEPVIFGLPIVLNPVFLIPFIFIPVVLTVISYFALATGLVPKTVAILPWTTPPILSGYLVTGGSWRGILLQVINLSIAVLIYIPFVSAGVRALKQRMMEKAS